MGEKANQGRVRSETQRISVTTCLGGFPEQKKIITSTEGQVTTRFMTCAHFIMGPIKLTGDNGLVPDTRNIDSLEESQFTNFFLKNVA